MIKIHPALYCAPATPHRQIYLHVLFFAHLQSIIYFKYFSAVCLLCVLANPQDQGPCLSISLFHVPSGSLEYL